MVRPTHQLTIAARDDAYSGIARQGELKLSGSMTRQAEQQFTATDASAHLANMGRMIEEMENRMRDSLQDVHFGKTKSTVNKLYRAGGAEIEDAKQSLARNLQEEMARRGGAKHVS